MVNLTWSHLCIHCYAAYLTYPWCKNVGEWLTTPTFAANYLACHLYGRENCVYMWHNQGIELFSQYGLVHRCQMLMFCWIEHRAAVGSVLWIISDSWEVSKPICCCGRVQVMEHWDWLFISIDKRWSNSTTKMTLCSYLFKQGPNTLFNSFSWAVLSRPKSSSTFRITCNSMFFLLVLYDPRIPFILSNPNSQKAGAGPKWRIESRRCRWRCMFGVMWAGYSTRTSSRNRRMRSSACWISVFVMVRWHSRRHTSTNFSQQRRWSFSSRPCKATGE